MSLNVKYNGCKMALHTTGKNPKSSQNTLKKKKMINNYISGTTGSLALGVFPSSAWGSGTAVTGLSSPKRSAVSSEASGWTDIPSAMFMLTAEKSNLGYRALA